MKPLTETIPLFTFRLAQLPIVWGYGGGLDFGLVNLTALGKVLMERAP
jgi:hypothetical protein